VTAPPTVTISTYLRLRNRVFVHSEWICFCYLRLDFGRILLINKEWYVMSGISVVVKREELPPVHSVILTLLFGCRLTKTTYTSSCWWTESSWLHYCDSLLIHLSSKYITHTFSHFCRRNKKFILRCISRTHITFWIVLRILWFTTY